jgi:hypothetical protein
MYIYIYITHLTSKKLCILTTQCIYMYFLQFSLSTATVSLDSINRFDFVAETQCVSCEVRTEFLYICSV